MCGIVGKITAEESREVLEHQLQAATSALRHRGPDGQGRWVHKLGIGLGHARLSILDLSEAGTQPMSSSDGSWTVTYNGEIYNYRALRKQLQPLGVHFRSQCDTEVLVEYLAANGWEATLRELEGMFAIAAWSEREQTLYLARDRLGQKPLCYTLQRGAFSFSSEVKALRMLASGLEICPESAALMLRYKCIPAPFTIYKGVYKLQAGHSLSFDFRSRTLSAPTPFWSLQHEKSSPSSPEDVRSQMEQAVQKRLISDVPLGAFLSGGIDSSLIVALMQKHSREPVKTFTMGFENPEYNEAENAAAIAKYLGTAHTELTVSSQDLLELVPLLPQIYDEPFGDSSQIPTTLVSRLARQHVTVALSGDGGDELFCGYNRHLWLPRLARLFHYAPDSLLNLLSKLLEARTLLNLLEAASRQGFLPIRIVRDKLDKLRRLMKTREPYGLYRGTVSDIVRPESLIPACYQGYTEEFPFSAHDGFSPLEYSHADLSFYLPNDILTKVDRASMSCGLEARAPFLDHHLVEAAFRLPMHYKVSGSVGKLFLRQQLEDFLPLELFERPKMGFAVPLEGWLRKELRDWAEAILATKTWDGLLHKPRVLALWEEHQSGRARHHHLLWNILMLLAWMESSK